MATITYFISKSHTNHNPTAVPFEVYTNSNLGSVHGNIWDGRFGELLGSTDFMDLSRSCRERWSRYTDRSAPHEFTLALPKMRTDPTAAGDGLIAKMSNIQKSYLYIVYI